ncbi:MAG TPA: DUF2332 domain-containing protein [Dongiaceae bacterium]|nr:DUF2332 domain-containing protein [Dongiaceae bacterium]
MAFETVLAAFRAQISYCEMLGSPFTAKVLQILLADLQAGGAVADIIGEWPGDPSADALPLRLTGALHALVLADDFPVLADCYPGGSHADDPARLERAIRTALQERPAHFADYLAWPPQTNETLRSAALLGGFTTIAAETGRPLRLLEIGASAGLNMLWDRFRYRLGATDFGPAGSPVVLQTDWRGPLPPLAMPSVRERHACDQAPVDLHDPAKRLRLCSYIWADQVTRMVRLTSAIALALETGITVEKADAADWLEVQLSAIAPGDETMTVLYHSVMWQYLQPATQRRITDLLEQTAARDIPLAWLRLEPQDQAQQDIGPGEKGGFAVLLTLWQGGLVHARRLARAHPHGAWVEWLGDGR